MLKIKYLYLNTFLKSGLSLWLFCLTFCVFGQECEPYIPMEEGAVFEQTSYDKKGRTQSRSVQKIVAKYYDGDVLTADIDGTTYDEKGNELSRAYYQIKCENGVFLLDLQGVVPNDAWANYQGMEINMTGDYLEMPPNPEVGQLLPEATLIVSVTNGGMAIATIRILVTDRKVEKKEKITTEAGTFDCTLFSYNVTSEIGALPIRSQSSSKDWYSKNAGLVRQETYNKKGKLTGHTELSALVLP